jgi:acyl-CoA synthetase (AMP-forming)/AMP-acid ligase II
VTPGDVAMRHEMFEHIQYAPQTEQVWHRPILFVPSIINKYHAFDLAPGRSLFEFLVKSGFTLFSMVFRNPRLEHDHWGMDALDVEVRHAWGMTEMSPLGTVGALKPPFTRLSGEQKLDVLQLQGYPTFGVQMKITDDAGEELPWNGTATGKILKTALRDQFKS